ncbi:response regulator [Azoarcus communis]|uniref:Two-component system response regulator n=1 Tax=Parazoarcus communis SWub3 = DSM 12120 TaxID=1121029 RepID=A0A323UX01_9RHOO|nr:two-component system response regulator [Parazoarcus communis]NMG46602.1 response regulator [Parazoarcus communis]NMG68935.1 response regulator [Parazoarcus communis SWub3 = DSM 12120]PZA16987.1 two-component system response regulator [Azoarcus communis] [Parazoarcus communis SWub3 = DSM 12120]
MPADLVGERAQAVGLADAASTILIVDDVPDNLLVLGSLLQPSYNVLAAPSGPRALEILAGESLPDLVLLDIMMPEMDGYEVLARIQDNPRTCDIPVIFLTALDSPGDEERGLEQGAADYITKPLQPAVVLARVRNQLELKRARDWLQHQNAFLEREVARRMEENDLTQLVTIRALAHLAETRDSDTGYHIMRTQAYVGLLAGRLRTHPRFADILTDKYVQLLVRSAPLHDIGKVGVPDHILMKPGSLTPAEWEVMKTHARLGADAIGLVERDIERPVPFLALAKEIARWHHERWDGTGYPDQLVADAIPVSARLMAVADVFDALTTPRPYKPAFSLERAKGLIEAGRGSHFDPDVVGAFIETYAEFVAVAERYRDADDDVLDVR